MSRPKLLDLFCGAGGAAMGYARAGFDVVGVDIRNQPNYPFKFRQADALPYAADSAVLAEFDAVHLSPPCQGYTTMSNRWRGNGGKADSWDRLIPELRHYLQRWGGPYVIENVPGARAALHDPITLRGGMFGLNVDRPRLFESNVPLGPTPPHIKPTNPIGVYGANHDGRRLFTRKDGSVQRAARSLAEASEAMGVDWMTWRELCESIPPAYTEFVGRRLAAHLSEVAA